MANASHHNISRAFQLLQGSAQLGSYNGGRNGVEWTPTFQWKPRGNLNITFTGVLAAGATGGTLNANFGPPSGFYPVTLSTGQIVLGLFIQGSTTVVFYPGSVPITGGVFASAGIGAAATASAVVANAPPVVGAANNISVSASIGAAGLAVLGGVLTTGAIVVNGVNFAASATPDVPRNIIGAWTGTAIATVAGFDQYNQPMTEVSASGTTLATKKAFAIVTSITMSAAVTAATFGTGNVLGLPFAVGSGDWFGALFNDAGDAGTFVQRDLTIPSSSTGDVRGTYAPAGTLNGGKFLCAEIRVVDTSTQIGAFGLTPV
jgi:hypothetical protein